MRVEVTRATTSDPLSVSTRSSFFLLISGVLYASHPYFLRSFSLAAGYEWREVPVDGYARRKRVGIPCEVFPVTSEYQSIW